MIRIRDKDSQHPRLLVNRSAGNDCIVIKPDEKSEARVNEKK